MKGFWRFLFFMVLVISGVWFYRWYKERQAERTKRVELFRSYLIIIRAENLTWERFLNINTGYFSNYQWHLWKNKNAKLYKDIQVKSYSEIGLSQHEITELEEFKDNFNAKDSVRTNFNNEFVKKELLRYSPFFDNIEGRKLDIQQRTAIVTDEDNNLVIAGAGSGKTTTIVGKVNYLIDRYKIDPKEILLISFTNKSASTLNSRISIPGVIVKTYNKFGKDIIVDTEKKQPSIYDVDQFEHFIARTLNELIRSEAYLKKVTDYFVHFSKPIKSQSDFKTQGEYFHIQEASIEF